MRILYVIDSLGTGGAERSTAYLWYYLREHNVKIKIVCLRKRKEGIQEEILNAGFDVEFLEKGFWYAQTRHIQKFIREFSPDIVHSILWKSNIRTRFARLSLKFYHIESLVNATYSEARIRDVGYFKLMAYRLVDKYSGRSGVDHFHSNGEFVATHYKDKLGIAPEKITVVKRGRFPNPYLNQKEKLKHTLRLQHSVDQDTIILVNVGRHEYQKGHDILLAALSEVKRKSNLKFKLLIAGRNGNATHHIMSEIETLSLSQEVVLLGHHSNVPKLLVASDIFILPSRFEGFPGSLIEAEAAGLPIICTELPPMLEVVIAGVNCETFKTDQSDQLAAAIMSLAGKPDLIKQYAKNSLIHFQENFQVPAINHEMLSLYQHLYKE